MSRDFSIYPELTPSQNKILREIGLTFFSLQGAEKAIQFCVSLVFSDEEATTGQDILSMRDSDRRKTLGQLIKVLQQRAEIQADFKQRINEFVQKRNRFVHGLFNEPEYSLGTEESIAKAHDFLLEFQQDIWNVSEVFMGYNVLFSKVLGVEEQIMNDLPEHGRKHLEQTWDNFSKTMDFKAPVVAEAKRNKRLIL